MVVVAEKQRVSGMEGVAKRSSSIIERETRPAALSPTL